jgi:DICT domain-containing protein/predicted DNA-binding transcriptional regulator AlpA
VISAACPVRTLALVGAEETLAIREVAEKTGMNAGTIRMWEQRYGFPVPQRTSAGYRRYRHSDVEALQRVLAYKENGLSVPAALERARAASAAATRPSLFAAIAQTGRVPARILRKRTLFAISRAFEDETLARAAGAVIVGAFQTVRNYRASEHRYRRLASVSDMTVVLADFDRVSGGEGTPVQVPLRPEDAIAHEWAVIVDSPALSACLLAWEPPADRELPDFERRFETYWSLDPEVVRRASTAAAELVRTDAPAVADQMVRLLADRPLAMDGAAPSLEAVMARAIDYMER